MLMDMEIWGDGTRCIDKKEVKEDSLNRFYVETFKWMFIGLMISAVTAFMTAVLGTMGYISTPLMFMLCIAELLLAMVFSAKFHNVSQKSAQAMYFFITFLNGVVLSSIFYVYELGSIAVCFVIAAGMFGIMALYGKCTKRDISKWSHMLTVALIACLIALIVNLILRNTWFDILVSVAVIIVMMLVTAYDFHMMKYDGLRKFNNSHIYFALSIYLDFLNIFLHILRLFGIKVKD